MGVLEYINQKKMGICNRKTERIGCENLTIQFNMNFAHFLKLNIANINVFIRFAIFLHGDFQVNSLLNTNLCNRYGKRADRRDFDRIEWNPKMHKKCNDLTIFEK